MKTLTKEQKCQVYKLALSYFIYPCKSKFPKDINSQGIYMCSSIEYALMSLFNLSLGDAMQLKLQSQYNQFPEFHENRPENTGIMVWWDTNEQGKQKRIKYLVKMIKLTSK